MGEINESQNSTALIIKQIQYFIVPNNQIYICKNQKKKKL